MSVVRSDDSEGAPVQPVTTPEERGLAARAMRTFVRASFMLALLAAVLLPTGFLWFTSQLPSIFQR